jgi:hypothetical protein
MLSLRGLAAVEPPTVAVGMLSLRGFAAAETTVVDAGTLRLGGSGGPRVVDAGTLRLGGGGPHIVDAGTLRLGGAGVQRVIDAGTLTLSILAPVAIRLVDAGTLRLRGTRRALLESFELASGTVEGGAVAAGAIRLDGPAPAGGIVILLESDSPAARVPASVRIPGGRESARFEINTDRVAAAVRALISASLAGGVMSRALTVNPPPPRDEEEREVVFEVVAVKLLRVHKIGGDGGGNTLPFLVMDVEEQIAGTATCSTPVTAPAGGFTTAVAIHIDADTGGCSVDTNIGAVTEAVRISEDGAASAAVAGKNGWNVSTVLILTVDNPNSFTASFGGKSFVVNVTFDINNPTNTLISVTVNALRQQ